MLRVWAVVIIMLSTAWGSMARAGEGEGHGGGNRSAPTTSVGASAPGAVAELRPAVPSAVSAPLAELASAVRASYDSPDAGVASLRALHKQYPADDDVAYWFAAAVGVAEPELALTALQGCVPARVPAFRVHWTRAIAYAARADAWRRPTPTAAEILEPQTAMRFDARAADLDAGRREMADVWRGASFPRDPAWPDMVALATWFDAQSGNDVDAVARLRGNGGSAGPYSAWTWTPGVRPHRLAVESGGRSVFVEASGLVHPNGEAAGRSPSARAAVREGPGPDLYGPDGRPCFPAPATRFDPSRDGAGWLYAAGADAPEGAGIFRIASCGGGAERVVAGRNLASPVRRRASEELLYVRDGAVMGTVRDPAPGAARVLRFALTEDNMILSIAIADAETHLRCDEVPCFVEDPPITRANPLPDADPLTPGPPPFPRTRPL